MHVVGGHSLHSCACKPRERGPAAPPRRSIEVRAIAFYDPPPLVPTEDLGVPRDKHICEAMKVGAR